MVDKLASRQQLPEKNRDHELSGDYAGFRECHVAPDWLLVYRVVEEDLILYLMRTGSPSDLFCPQQQEGGQCIEANHLSSCI